MKLVRLVFIIFDKNDIDFFKGTNNLEIDDVTINSLPVNNPPDTPLNQQRNLILATIELEKLPSLNKLGEIEVPNQERKKTEQAIELFSNLVSVTSRCSRKIVSPTPCIAFIPKNKKELLWLEKSEGVVFSSVPFARPCGNIKITNQILNILQNRTDGLALLAESLASKHAATKYREYIRFFECAFKLSAIDLRKKLFQFLKESNSGYTRDEINNWISFRHGSMHADGKKTQEIVYESDVCFIVKRMEQATFDVLFNKKIWGCSSRHRIDNWKPNTATTDDLNNLQVTIGKSLHVEMQIYDSFKVYPLDLSGNINKLPNGLWSKDNSKSINQDNKKRESAND